MSLGIVLTPWGKIKGGYAPYGIAYDYAGATSWYGSNSAGDAPNAPGNMDPRLDPQHFERGEAGYYYDTQLGRTVGIGAKPTLFERIKARFARKPLSGFPTDFQLATIRGYLPVEGGWVQTQQGYLSSGPWLPPHGDPGWADPRFPVPVVPIPTNEMAGIGLGRALGRLGQDVAAQVPSGQAASVEDVMAALIAHNDRLFALTLVSTTAVAVSALLGVFRTLKLIREDARD